MIPKRTANVFLVEGLVSQHNHGGLDATISGRIELRLHEKNHRITVRIIKRHKRMR